MIRSRMRRTALVAIGAVAAAGLTALPATPAQAQGACDVDYRQTWDSGSGFGADITITNLGESLNGWELTFTFPGNQQVDHGWVAVWSQQGADVTAANESWNASLGSGQSVTIGFNGSYSGSNEPPTSFALNGVPCNGEEPPGPTPEISITSPADGAQFNAPADITVEADASISQGSIDEVEFYINGNLAGADPNSPYSFTHEEVPEGSYTLTARAVAGDETAEDEVSVQVDAPADPTVLTTLNTVNFTEGGSGSYGVSLSEEPAGSVTVSTERSSGSTGITVTEGAQLTFDASNWDDPQDVVVSAAEGTGGESAVFTSTAPGHVAADVTVNSIASDGEVNQLWIDRFMEQYDKIKNSGYFSSHGIPYHSIEELIVEAPDYGHVTTSEAFSYWLWLEANYGRIQQDWEPFNQAWQTMETYIIPGSDDQPSAGVAGDATYAAEHPLPSDYPSALDDGVPVGEDPLRSELESTHGTGEIYGMHWLLDVDNAYGYGHCGDGTTSPSYINTFQRGEQESVWETVPHPSCETFDFGGENGFLPIFIDDPNGGAQQWRYTNAPDADARAIQAAYWALTWARDQGNESQISDTIADAAKMGDYLRYSLFDKYFKQVGNCVGATDCPGATGRDSAHYLLSWYYAWGGSYPGNDWSWRIGSSHNHFGYQNPLSAWAMVNEPALQTSSSSFTSDWQNSLDRTLEFYLWLQSPEGGIAGGATNSWGGSYDTPPAGTPTFYGMFYDDCPVYHDPCSNEWFGMQVWSLQRLAEYLYLTGDERAQQVLDRWVPWAISETTVGTGGDFAVPATMEWSGAPSTWDPDDPLGHTNPNLSVDVVEHGQDVGVAAAYARTLLWYAAATGDTTAKDTAAGLLDALWANMGDRGITTPETRGDYERFLDEVYIPSGFSGQMGNGEIIEPGVTFYDLRESIYEDVEMIDEVLAYANGNGEAPVFEYHRSWAQMDIANAFADFAHLFPNG